MRNADRHMRISLEALQHDGREREEAYSTARNRNSQCQATLVVKLPIREGVSNVDELLALKPVAEEVLQQYYTKLLEDTVGVTPHGPVLELATAELGLTTHTIKSQTRVVGAALQVAGAAPTPPQPPGLPFEQLALLQSLQPLLSQQEQQGIVGASSSTRANGGQVQDDNVFARSVRLLSQPFCAERTLYKAGPAVQAAAAAVARRTATKHCAGTNSSSCSSASGRQAAGANAGASASGLLAEHLQELSQEFLVTPKAVSALQQLFASHMSSHLLGPHATDLARWGLTAADVAATEQLLSITAVIKLATTLLHYLYTRFIAESSDFPAQLVTHLKAQAQANSKKQGLTAKRRPTATGAAAAALAAGASAGSSAPSGTTPGPGPGAGVSTDESESPEKWDLGCELLLQRKAEEAAEQLRSSSAAAAEAMHAEARQLSLLPHGVGRAGRLAAAAARASSQADADSAASSRSSSRPVSSTGHLALLTAGDYRQDASQHRPLQLLHQESSCSSKSKSSFAGSVASFKQQAEAAQRKAEMLASASPTEVQSCRLSGMLQQWDELRRQLSRSQHGSTFALPILLLSLGWLAEEVFSNAFPAWRRSSHGARVVAAIAAAPAQLLDPQHCYRSLMVLAGGPAAVVARQRHASGPLVAVDKRHRHLGVSSVVAAAIGPQPGSPALKRMMQAAGAASSIAAGSVGSTVCETAGTPHQQQQQVLQVSLGGDVVHAVAAHKMTRLVKRK